MITKENAVGKRNKQAPPQRDDVLPHSKAVVLWTRGGGGGGGGLLYEGDPSHFALGFWSHLGCCGQNANILRHQGLV